MQKKFKMAKFYGIIGYSETHETSPGIYTERIVEREYYGDVTRAYRRNQGSDKVNQDVILHHEFSVIADPYACEHYGFMRYICYGSVKWVIESVEFQYPRLVITTGGLYNE